MKNTVYKLLSFAFLITVFTIQNTQAQWLETDKVVAPDRMENDFFGYDVKTSADYAVIGAPQHNGNTGKAYVYKRTAAPGSLWELDGELIAPLGDAHPQDRFGYSVAITDNGDFIVIGAPFQDFDHLGNNEIQNSGAVYIFERDVAGDWIFTQKIVAAGPFGNNDREIGANFGWDVDISAGKIIVGAFGKDAYSSQDPPMLLPNAGSAYIFEYSTGGGSWYWLTKLTASDRATGDNFGWSVAISELKAVIGAPRNRFDNGGGNELLDSGAAYVFENLEGTSWDETKITSTDRGANEQFGFAVDIDANSNHIIVGVPYDDDVNDPTAIDSGSAFTFSRDNLTGTWPMQTKLLANDRAAYDHFGAAVACAKLSAVVGAPFKDTESSEDPPTPLPHAGAAYIFEFGFTFPTGYTWNLDQKIVPSDRDLGDNFGNSVSIDPNFGAQCVVGARAEDHDDNNPPGNMLSSAGSAYIFELDAPKPFTKLLETNEGEFNTANLIVYSITTKVYEVNYRTTRDFGKLSYSVFNALGQETTNGTMENDSGGYRVTLDLNTVANGVYFLELSNESYKITKRFLVK